MNDWAKNAVTRLSSDIKTTKVTWQYKIPTGKVNKVFSLDFIYFYLFYFICNTIITKNKGKERKKKEVVRRRNRNYRTLWEVRPTRTSG